MRDADTKQGRRKRTELKAKLKKKMHIGLAKEEK